MKEYLNRVASILALLLVPSAIIGVNASVPGFESFFVFRIFLFLLFALTLLSFLTNQNQAQDFLRSLKEKRYLIMPLILLLYSVATIFTATDTGEAVRYTVLLATGVFHFYFLLFYFSSEEGTSRLYKAILFTFSLALFAAVLEMMIPGFRMPISNLLGAPERFQIALTSFFHNQNDFSAYIALTLPFLCWPLIVEDNRPALPISLSFGLCLLALFIFSFNSSKIILIALVIFSMTMLFYAVLRSRSSFGTGKQNFVLKSRALYGYMAICAILLLLPFPTLGPDIKNFTALQVRGVDYTDQVAYAKRQSEMLRGAPTGHFSEEPEQISFFLPRENMKGQERIQLMHKALDVIANKGTWGYIAGVGAGNIEHYMAQYDELGGLTNVHNWWLEIFANFGILGVLIVGLFVAYLIKDTFILAKATDGLFAKISLTSLLILLLAAISPSSLKALQIHWIVFGFAAANLVAKTKPQPQ